MNDTDEDLATIRRMVAPRTTRTLTRSWESIVSAASVPEPRRRSWRARIAVPAAAGLLVVAVVAGAVYWTGSRAETRGQQPGGGPSSPVDTKEHRPNQGPPAAAAVAALQSLADVAGGVQPAPLTAGQVLYVRSVGWALAFQGVDPSAATVEQQVHEVWLDPQGLIALKIMNNGEDLTAPGPKSNHAEEVDRLRSLLAQDGPSLVLPTPQWLDQLPTDPAALLAELRSASQPGSSWSDDHQVWTAMHELFRNADLILPTDLRIALYRALAGLTGLTATQVTIAGRALVAIRHAEANDAQDVLFDPETGHAVGDRTAVPADSGITVPVVPGYAPGTVSQGIWTQAVVDAAGDRS